MRVELFRTSGRPVACCRTSSPQPMRLGYGVSLMRLSSWQMGPSTLERYI